MITVVIHNLYQESVCKIVRFMTTIDTALRTLLIMYVCNHVLNRSKDLVVKYNIFIIRKSMVDITSHNDCFNALIKYRNTVQV